MDGRYANRVSEPKHCYRHPDRETGLSCSECGRPICVDCMTVAPVGIRCPDHAAASGTAAAPKQAARRAAGVQRAVRSGVPGDARLVTKVLIGLNVLVYLITVAQGGGINAPGGRLFTKFLLFGPYVKNGDWWRLITSAFLHGSILHIAFNMLALWWIGGPVETVMGRWKYLALYLISGLAGAAGSLLVSPLSPTVGASGAIFGLLGAMLILQWQATGTLAGPALTLIIINLVFSFAVPNISYGGHIGGLVGGILATLAMTDFGTKHVSYARISPTAVLVLIGIGVLSVAVAYWRVHGLA
ncbi:MAG: rhomboid family intramembrane serine protease [Candidatus Rokuibacteriota bacterium]|nr:MAG: rhomboid family intramembrane serine protease [Candidatus Rokubacteria bacterium]